jgi:hypothetical protein
MSPKLLCPPACMQLLLPNQETTGRMFISLFVFAFPHINNQVKWENGFWTSLAYMINVQHLDSTVHNQSTCSHASALRKFLLSPRKIMVQVNVEVVLDSCY